MVGHIPQKRKDIEVDQLITVIFVTVYLRKRHAFKREIIFTYLSRKYKWINISSVFQLLLLTRQHLFSVIQRRQNARYSSESTLTAASSFRSKSPSEDLIGGLFSGIPIVKEIAMLWASMSELRTTTRSSS